MKGFVICWFFPPINSSEGLVTFKLLKNSKLEHDVFTQNNNEGWSYKTNETKLVSNNIHTIFSKENDYGKWVEDGFNYFDRNSEKYDFIMSRSMPPESHVMALRIKEKYPNIKWIASFGDPIYDNPYTKFYKEECPYSIKGQSFMDLSFRYIISPKRILKNMYWHFRRLISRILHPSKNKSKEIQENTIRKADVLIFNNEYQKEHMLKEYSDEIKKKAVILPHTYDSDFYEKEIVKKDTNKIRISYLGHLDYYRTPDVFLKAVNRMYMQDKNLADKLIIEFYGDLGINDKIYIIDNELYDFVRVKKPVKYFDTLKIMQESDWVLLIDANLSSVIPQNIFFAAKLADYIGAKTNILGITMLEGTSADIINDIGGVVSSYSADEIYMYLKMILDKKLKCNFENTEKYDASLVAKTYDDIIRKICKE